METLVVRIRPAVSPKEAFFEIIKKLEDAGLSLVNPTLGGVTTFNATEAVQKIVVIQDLREFFYQDTTDNFQMWFDAGTDVFISWDKVEMSIYLDGKTEEQRNKILECLVRYFTKVSVVGGRFEWQMNFTFE